MCWVSERNHRAMPEQQTEFSSRELIYKPLEKWWEGWDIFSLHEFFFPSSLAQEVFFFATYSSARIFFSLFLEKNRRAAIEIVNTFKTSWILNIFLFRMTKTWFDWIFFYLCDRRHVVWTNQLLLRTGVATYGKNLRLTPSRTKALAKPTNSQTCDGHC